MNIAYREALHSLRANPCPRQRVIPPNRLEAGNVDLLASLIPRPGSDALMLLNQSLQKLLGRQNIFFAPSARCAIAQLLALLPQREVVMPAFNCDVVKSAVEAAGKDIIYVDLAKNSVNATAAEFSAAAKPGRILLITHQFGVATDAAAICELGRDRGCITIEDAACCFGAVSHGRPIGTSADFGVFSFENWKRLPAFRGGAIVVNNERIFDLTKISAEPLVKTTLKLPVRELVSALGRNVATMPWLYGRAVLPRLIRNYFKPVAAAAPTGQRNVTGSAPYTRAFHPYQARLVSRMLERFEPIRNHIGQLASIYSAAFENSPITTFVPAGQDNAGLLRYPISFPRKKRAEVLRRALARGIYLETAFEELLPEPADRPKFPNAEKAGHDLVLLPLYARLSLKDARWLAQQINEIAAGNFDSSS